MAMGAGVSSIPINMNQLTARQRRGDDGDDDAAAPELLAGSIAANRAAAGTGRGICRRSKTLRWDKCVIICSGCSVWHHSAKLVFLIPPRTLITSLRCQEKLVPKGKGFYCGCLKHLWISHHFAQRVTLLEYKHWASIFLRPNAFYWVESPVFTRWTFMCSLCFM